MFHENIGLDSVPLLLGRRLRQSSRTASLDWIIGTRKRGSRDSLVHQGRGSRHNGAQPGLKIWRVVNHEGLLRLALLLTTAIAIHPKNEGPTNNVFALTAEGGWELPGRGGKGGTHTKSAVRGNDNRSHTVDKA